MNEYKEEDRDSLPARGEAKTLLVDHRGEPLEIPPEGSLWLLALGWRGIVAWRHSRERAGLGMADHLVYLDSKPEDRS